MFSKVCRSCVTLGFLKLSDNKFQADGPATEKARRPYVCNRWRGSTWSRRLADVLRCCREAMSETGRQRSTKYCSAWPCTQIVSEMTYNVSMGTLNPTIPYYTIPYHTLHANVHHDTELVRHCRLGHIDHKWTWQCNVSRNCWLLYSSDF